MSSRGGPPSYAPPPPPQLALNENDHDEDDIEDDEGIDIADLETALQDLKVGDIDFFF
jgi:hypothetical protein